MATEVARHRSFRLNLDAGSIPAASTNLRISLEIDGPIDSLAHYTWAACGKDPGFSPAAILEQAARTTRYTELELAGLDFDGPVPSAGELSRTWHAALTDAREVTVALPAEHAGKAVLEKSGGLFRGVPHALRTALEADDLIVHPGSIRGAFPMIQG